MSRDDARSALIKIYVEFSSARSIREPRARMLRTTAENLDAS